VLFVTDQMDEKEMGDIMLCVNAAASSVTILPYTLCLVEMERTDLGYPLPVTGVLLQDRMVNMKNISLHQEQQL